MSDIITETIKERHALPVLSVKQLGKTFSIGHRQTQILHDVNLSVKKGEFVCLFGALGCGKSTLLRILAGFETATSGIMKMYGVPITRH